MRKRDRTVGHHDERQVNKRFGQRLFIKKEGGLRFDALRRFHYWWLGGRSLTRSIFRITAAWQGVAIIGGVLMTGYVMAAFYTGAGEFVIRVDHPGEKKLIIDDTPAFEDEKIVLKGEAIDEADNISIFDIDPRVAEVDGPHNGIDYVAYTFYVKNVSYDPITYNKTLSIRHADKGIDKAAWIMVVNEGKQTIYAASRSDGTAEWQWSESPFPFMDMAENPDMMTKDGNGYRLTATPFLSDKIIESEQRGELMPGEIDKYTVVIWLEGEDPECGNDILGGTLELIFKIKY